MSKKKTDFTAAAQEATAFMFSGFQKPQKEPQEASADNSSNTASEAVETANTSSQTAPRPAQKQARKKQGKRSTHKLYAAWIDKDTLSKWKAYTDTKNITSEELMMCAINHYINHEYPIAPEEQEAYNEYLEQERQLINENARGKRL